jgi:RNA polymerase sigma-70 factor (ECF subfamily)
MPRATRWRPGPGHAATSAGESFHAWALQVVEVDGGRITTITSFLDAATVFPRFGLPLHLERT